MRFVALLSTPLALRGVLLSDRYPLRGCELLGDHPGRRGVLRGPADGADRGVPGVPMKPPILDRLRGVRRTRTGWLAFCPSHDDRERQSLSVSVRDDGRTLVHCFAGGCTAEQIARAVGMSLAELCGSDGNSGPRRAVKLLPTTTVTSAGRCSTK